jgi:hypothetical protein
MPGELPVFAFWMSVFSFVPMVVYFFQNLTMSSTEVLSSFTVLQCLTYWGANRWPGASVSYLWRQGRYRYINCWGSSGSLWRYRHWIKFLWHSSSGSTNCLEQRICRTFCSVKKRVMLWKNVTITKVKLHFLEATGCTLCNCCSKIRSQ